MESENIMSNPQKGAMDVTPKEAAWKELMAALSAYQILFPKVANTFDQNLCVDAIYGLTKASPAVIAAHARLKAADLNFQKFV
jgi:hypothetical protein